jgi:hypothetical protein
MTSAIRAATLPLAASVMWAFWSTKTVTVSASKSPCSEWNVVPARSAMAESIEAMQAPRARWRGRLCSHRVSRFRLATCTGWRK